jgi:hypothetical protein
LPLRTPSAMLGMGRYRTQRLLRPESLLSGVGLAFNPLAIPAGCFLRQWLLAHLFPTGHGQAELP